MIMMNAPRLLAILTIAISVIMILDNGAVFVNAEETPICRGDTITITAVLLQNITYGDPISNQRIEFYDETNDIFLGMALTDENGVASIQWDIPLTQPLGETLINSTFRGNDSLFLDPSAQWTVITIFSRTEILILSDDTLLAPGDNYSISARIVDDVGNGVSNICVSAFVNDQYIFSTFTNSSGYFKFKIEYNSSLFNLGTNAVKLVSVNSDQLFCLGAVKTVIIEYRQLQVAISEFGFVNKDANLNDSMNLVFYVHSNDIPLSGIELDVIIDNTYLGTWITNSEGIANISIIINNTVDIGKHIIGVQFSGNYRYEKASLKMEINVYSMAILKTILPERVVAYSYSSLILSINDALGRPYENMTIGVSDQISNYTYWTKTKNTERVQIPYIPIGPNGPRTLTVVIIDQPFISNKTLNITINVWSKPRFNIIAESICGYAMPMQRITLTCRLEDSVGALSEVGFLVSKENGSFHQFILTNESGYASIECRAQSENGPDYVSLIFQGDNTSYYLSSEFRYEYHVSHQIPVDVIMISYSLVVPLRQISMYLLTIARNGTQIHGLDFDYYWLEQEGYTKSDESGVIYLSIPMPNSNGTFLLYYETRHINGLAQSSGTFFIIINQAQAHAAQGIGINGLLASCMTIVFSAIAPFLRQRYLIGS